MDEAHIKHEANISHRKYNRRRKTNTHTHNYIYRNECLWTDLTNEFSVLFHCDTLNSRRCLFPSLCYSRFYSISLSTAGLVTVDVFWIDPRRICTSLTLFHLKWASICVLLLLLRFVLTLFILFYFNSLFLIRLLLSFIFLHVVVIVASLVVLYIHSIFACCCYCYLVIHLACGVGHLCMSPNA